jgi:hypothetical protein
MTERDIPQYNAKLLDKVTDSQVLAILIILVIVIGVVGSVAYWVGNNAGYSAGYQVGNPDYIKIQQSIRAAETSYVGLLQQALDKMADVSQNKSAKISTAGFDTLASIFNFSSQTPDVWLQDLRLCNQTDTIHFINTATLTGHPNITVAYQNSCKAYPVLANDYSAFPNADLLPTLSSHFTDLVFNLMKLDNTISEDP